MPKELETKILEYLESRVDVKRWPYHSIEHTRNVVRDADALASLSRVAPQEKRLLHVAALFHDTGYATGPEQHEAASAALAEAWLPQFGFEAGEIAVIRQLILATKLPASPQSGLEELICDADLGVLASDGFPAATEALRREFGFAGVEFSEKAWWQFEADFFAKHRYYSAAAQKMFAAGLERNYRSVIRLLHEAKDSGK